MLRVSSLPKGEVVDGAKESKAQSAEPKTQDTPEAGRQGGTGGAYAGLLKLARAAGNRAFGQWVQDGSPVALAEDDRQWLEASAGSLPPIAIDQSPEAQQVVGSAGAYAAARGSQIAAEAGAFAGMSGKARLAHEVAHILQQRANGLPSGSLDDIEADADRFAHLAVSGQRASVQRSAPDAWAYEKKRPTKKTVQAGDKVTSMAVYKDSQTVVVRMQSGDEFAYSYSVLKLPGDRKSYTASFKGGKITVDAPGETVLYISGSRSLPNPARLPFPSSFPLTVHEKGASYGSGGGKGQGQGTGTKPGEQSEGKKKEEGGGSPEGSKEGGGEKPKEETPATPGATETTPNPENQPPATEAIPGDTAPPPPEVKVPVITITDLKQIEELKKRGLIPAETADQIKAKLEKQEQLTFDEALKLIDALNQVTTPPKGEKPEEMKESWLKWARFVAENKDKISGRTKTGAGGMTVDEVKEIIKKHNEFVGVVDAPKAPEGKKKNFDPQTRKSWNNLPEWQKEVWKDYLKRFPEAFNEDSDRKDVQLRDSDLFAMAMRMSGDYIKGGGREAFYQLINDPLFIGGTMASISLYLAAWMFPEPLFSKATAATITIALLAVFSATEIKNLAVAWMRLSDESAKARSMDDLEVAAEHFGKALGGTLMRVLVTLATLLAGKALPSPKPTVGGGTSGPTPAPAGGPALAPAEALAVRVTASGTLEILGPALGGAAMASSGSGSGGGSKEAAKETEPTPENTKPKTDPVEDFKQRGGEVKKLPPGPEPKNQPTAQPKGKDQLGAAKEAVGEGPESGAMKETGKAGAGMARAPRHHIFPQKFRAWFRKRGFTGKRDIDEFTVELDQASHEAIHGGGDWKLGRTWPGEWNNKIMSELKAAEAQLGRKLTFDEIMAIGKRLMGQYKVDKPFVPYKE